MNFHTWNFIRENEFENFSTMAAILSLPLFDKLSISTTHDDVIKFPRYWPFVRGIHRSPVDSPHKGQWRGALMFSLICARINSWVNNGEAGDLRRHRGHYDVIVMRFLLGAAKIQNCCIAFRVLVDIWFCTHTKIESDFHFVEIYLCTHVGEICIIVIWDYIGFAFLIL